MSCYNVWQIHPTKSNKVEKTRNWYACDKWHKFALAGRLFFNYSWKPLKALSVTVKSKWTYFGLAASSAINFSKIGWAFSNSRAFFCSWSRWTSIYSTCIQIMQQQKTSTVSANDYTCIHLIRSTSTKIPGEWWPVISILFSDATALHPFTRGKCCKLQ